MILQKIKISGNKWNITNYTSTFVKNIVQQKHFNKNQSQQDNICYFQESIKSKEKEKQGRKKNLN